MDKNIENVHEEITTSVDAITVDIPLRVEMTSVNSAPFEFTASIDDVGQIVLTPTSKDIEFISANTADNVEFDIPIMEQETITETDPDSDVNYTRRLTSILIKGSMLAETENHSVSADVDEIGQVIIYPLEKNNMFVSASIEESLNLVTEDMQVEMYNGYKLINTGDGWDIIDYTGNTIEEGVATLHEAKILVCKEELTRLESLMEETSPEEHETEEVPEITAEVIEEAILPEEETPNALTPEEIFTVIKQITNEFTENKGGLKCDSHYEEEECVKILENYYEDVTVTGDIDSDKIVIRYSNLKTLVESVDEQTLNIINRFMRGDIALFSDNGEPLASYIHMTDLDAHGYTYYYDPETDAIISYPVKE